MPLYCLKKHQCEKKSNKNAFYLWCDSSTADTVINDVLRSLARFKERMKLNEDWMPPGALSNYGLLPHHSLLYL